MKKIIYQPLNPFIITQKFGENLACKSTDGKSKVITCNGLNPPAGYVSLYGPLGHGAIDLRSTHGQEVYCSAPGKVYKIDTDAESGLDVRVESEIDGLKFRIVYEHLLGYQPKVGDKVEVGDLIGWADNTGYSSGDHLHFQMMLWDGKDYVKVDPMLYMENLFALKYKLQTNLIGFLKEYVAKLLDNSAYKLRNK